eukprot:TRINITY_DN6942_c0_g1_i1.p1 TRINITY_DN6942_c0_g1~~TRINITY_DN6942_c0_g1_i1.p1  ORF type:complete len:178 (+),score=15.01 TRINITY_DN6942_c0_g1_i1:84-617(+)
MDERLTKENTHWLWRKIFMLTQQSLQVADGNQICLWWKYNWGLPFNMERCVAKCFQVNHCKCITYYKGYGVCRMETGPYLWNTGSYVYTGLEVHGPCKTHRELAKCQWKKQYACVGSIIGDYRLTRAEGIEKCLHMSNCHCVTYFPLEKLPEWKLAHMLPTEVHQDIRRLNYLVEDN